MKLYFLRLRLSCIALTYFVLLGCDAQDELSNVELRFEEISIPLSAGYLNYYHKNDIIETDTGSFFIGYNRFDDSFDYFNLDTKQVSKRYFIPEQGPLSIEGFVTFFTASHDYLIIRKKTGEFSVRNHSGIELKSLSLDSINGFDSLKLKYNWRYQGLVFSNYESVYMSEDNELILKLFPNTTRSASSYYESFGIVYIPIDSLEKAEIFQLDYPDDIRSNRYGDLDRPEFTLNARHEIISSFPCSKNILVLPLAKTDDVRELELDCSFVPKETGYSEKDYFPRWKYISTAPRFFPLVYSPHQKCYFRLMKEETQEGEFYEKTKIMVYDERFSLIKVQDVSPKADVFLLPTPEGIYIPFNEMAYDHEDSIKFYKVELLHLDN